MFFIIIAGLVLGALGLFATLSLSMTAAVGVTVAAAICAPVGALMLHAGRNSTSSSKLSGPSVAGFLLVVIGGLFFIGAVLGLLLR